MPITAFAIGGGIGALKGLLVDKPKEAKERKLAATTIKYSPWTGMRADPVERANIFGSALNTGAAAALAGPAIKALGGIAGGGALGGAGRAPAGAMAGGLPTGGAIPETGGGPNLGGWLGMKGSPMPEGLKQLTVTVPPRILAPFGGPSYGAGYKGGIFGGTYSPAEQASDEAAYAKGAKRFPEIYNPTPDANAPQNPANGAVPPGFAGRSPAGGPSIWSSLRNYWSY